VTFVDKTLTCRDCGQEFVFSAGEQEFYQARGLLNEPRRCPNCRAARRATVGRADGGMAGARPQREMHDVICSNCGKMTQVPFVPTGSRPVYCMDCFQTARRY
jgi:CxxC-x17-CxxC domain-containing protein